MAFDRVLVPLDGSQAAEESLAHAARLAHAYKSRLFLLQVLDVQRVPGQHRPEELDWRLLKIQALGYLNSLAERLAEEGLETECRVLEGRAPDQILEFIRDWRIDLVVLSAYGWGGESEFPMGGTAQKIIASPETSVMIARPTPGSVTPSTGYARVLVPLDGSQRAAWAVSLVSGMSDGVSPEIILLHVVVLPDMPRTRPRTREEEELRAKLVECNRRAAVAYLEDIRNRFAGSVDIRTRLEVSPHIVDTIKQVADSENVDLIALTAHGESGVGERDSGTICQSLVLSAIRPVLVLQDNPARYRGSSDTHASDWPERRIRAV